MRRVAMIMGLVAVTGCAALGRQAFQQPRVSLRDVRITGIGVTGGELEVALNVQNPNNYRLDTSQLEYQLFVSDTVPVARGTMDSRATVQAGDSSIVRIPVAFTYAGIGVLGRQLMQTGVVSYRVTGSVTVASVTGNFTVPFSSTGHYSTMRR